METRPNFSLQWHITTNCDQRCRHCYLFNSPDAKIEIAGEDIPDGKIAVDIGPKTILLFEEKLKCAKTIVWNGPLGIFEMPAFSKGTQEIAKFIANLKCTSIIGGGDTAAAIGIFSLSFRYSNENRHQ